MRRSAPFLVALLLLALVAVFHAGRPTTPAEPVSPDRPTASARPSPPAPSHPALASATPALAAAVSAPRPGLPVDPAWLETLGSGPDAFSLTDSAGTVLRGIIEHRDIAPDGSVAGIDGRILAPHPGRFYFRAQPAGDLAGPVTGVVHFPAENFGYRMLRDPAGNSCLTRLPIDQVACRSLPIPEAAAEPDPEEIPADHPTSIPIPGYQNGIIPLQSRPSAVGVIYLDFDGEPGPHSGWGDFDAVAPSVTVSSVKAVWQRVAEDFAAFDLNVTTDLQVYLDAPENSRQRCIITPTTDAAPSAGGVAYVGSFNSTGDTPCWAFYSTGKSSAEVISHEIGHTLGLSHDGRSSPSEEYYGGHGSGDTGWAPIMGVGYSKNLTQWSKGEYLNANRTQDDLSIIVNNNNNSGYRPDDAGPDHASSVLLETYPGGTVEDEGTIETTGDTDAFRFTTTGGSLSLQIDPVSAGPNLDLEASLHDSSGTQLLADNPDLALDANLSTTLAAGTYTLRVRGVGRGDPLGSGYSDYSSLGQYTIAGTITGVTVPDRFLVQENASSGTPVGTPTPAFDHGAAPLTWSIASGNGAGAFAIDPATGLITVAPGASLDYEALSSGWNDVPVFDLTVSIADPLDPLLDELLRVTIQLADQNEAPSISPASFIAISHTRPGTALGQLDATDPDQLDLLGFSIVAGDPSGTFAIDLLGRLSVAGPLDAATRSSHTLTIRATDQGLPALHADATVTVTVVPGDPSLAPGLVRRTIYDGISGSTISSLTSSPDFPANPTREVDLDAFDDTTRGDNYGSTVRAWMIAPRDGRYRFWIAGDDASELRLSTSGNPATASVVASFTGWTDYQQWTKFSSQRSAFFTLAAGQLCYLEARHKEGGGGDHLSVAWEILDSSGSTILVPREIIPATFLAPHEINYRPRTSPVAASLHRNRFPGTPAATVSFSDLNPADSHTHTILSGNASGAFALDPATGVLSVADPAALDTLPSPSAITIETTDDGQPALSATSTLTLDLIDPAAPVTDGLLQEIWDGITGNPLSNLYNNSRYPDRPDRLRELSEFDTGTDIANNYGARVRVWLIPPATGDYTFRLASDDYGALLLATDGIPANATEIASVPGWSGHLEWTKFPAQTSAPVTLTAGTRYYLEARVKEGTGGDHLAVAWTGPGIATPTVLGDDVTEPFDSNLPPEIDSPSYLFNPTSASGPLGTIQATDAPFETLTYAILDNPDSAPIAIAPLTGTLTATDPAALIPGRSYALLLGAQDNGHGGHFPPRHSTVPATLRLAGELVVAPGETLTLPEATYSPDAVTVRAGGTLVLESGSLGTPGDLINHGTLHLLGDAALSIGGSFTNHGILDLIHWDGTLPAGFTNAGTLLDRSSIQFTQREVTPGTWTLSLPGHPRHAYQLQSAPAPAGPWTDLGSPSLGNGSPLDFPVPTTGAHRFFRLAVTPAP